jgi:chromosome segregation ATPase
MTNETLQVVNQNLEDDNGELLSKTQNSSESNKSNELEIFEEFESLKALTEQQKAEILKFSTELENRDTLLEDSKKQYIKLMMQKNELKQYNKELKDEIKSLEAESLQGELDSKNGIIHQLEIKNTDLLSQLDAEKTQKMDEKLINFGNENLETNNNIDSEKSYEELQSELETLQKYAAAYIEEIQVLKGQKPEIRDRADSFGAENTKAELESVKESYKDLMEQLQSAKDIEKTLKAENGQFKIEIDNLASGKVEEKPKDFGDDPFGSNFSNSDTVIESLKQMNTDLQSKLEFAEIMLLESKGGIATSS